MTPDEERNQLLEELFNSAHHIGNRKGYFADQSMSVELVGDDGMRRVLKIDGGSPIELVREAVRSLRQQSDAARGGTGPRI